MVDGLRSNIAVRTAMKLQMGKGRRGITPCGGYSTIELLPHLVEQAGLEPATDDNPQLRPIKSSGQEKRLWNCPVC